MANEPTYEELKQRVQVLEKEAADRDHAYENTKKEVSYGLSEVLEAMKKISEGDPSVMIPETSPLELMTKLKRSVNLTAGTLAEIVDLSHEFAIGLAEHFDVLHKVSEGDFKARIAGRSNIELLEALKEMTNQMIESVFREITQRQQAEEEIR
jgi:hypothetical protein